MGRAASQLVLEHHQRLLVLRHHQRLLVLGHHRRMLVHQLLAWLHAMHLQLVRGLRWVFVVLLPMLAAQLLNL